MTNNNDFKKFENIHDFIRHLSGFLKSTINIDNAFILNIETRIIDQERSSYYPSKGFEDLTIEKIDKILIDFENFLENITNEKPMVIAIQFTASGETRNRLNDLYIMDNQKRFQHIFKVTGDHIYDLKEIPKEAGAWAWD